jgi:arylsulfatase A-like enzyme
VVGRSDAQGGMPADNPVHVSDFVATIYHALGYGSQTYVTDQAGRPHFVVEGKPVLELF